MIESSEKLSGNIKRNIVNQKEVALQQAIKDALQQHNEFYLNNIKIEVLSIKWALLSNAYCVCPTGLDSSNWDQCEEGLCDAELKLSYKINTDECEARFKTNIGINFKVTDYKDDVFNVEIINDKLNLIKL